MDNARVGLSSVASVRILRASRLIDKDFDYILPPELLCHRGSVVGVPFGKSNKETLAVVVSIKEKTAESLKTISFVLDEPYAITEESLQLASYVSDQIFSTFGDVCSACLPSGLHTSCKNFYTRGPEFSKLLLPMGRIPTVMKEKSLTPHQIYDTLSTLLVSGTSQSEEVLCAAWGKKMICWLREKKILTRTACLSWRANVKTQRCIRLGEDSDINRIPKGKNREKYLQLYDYLLQAGNDGATVTNMRDLFQLNLSHLKTLERNGIITLFETVFDRSIPVTIKQDPPGSHPILTPEQSKAYDRLLILLQENKPNASLLFGVTGSGKTNVLLELMDACLKRNQSVIYMVPEIALTSQAQEKFIRRFGETVCVLHSGLSEGERHDAWVSIKDGRKKVVLGTRSAVFAPCQNIGLIIMDEEQDDSYKSDGAFKYHTRTIARFRAAYHNALLVFSSATPDVESFYKAQKGDYSLVMLENRYGNSVLPAVRIIDLRADAERNPSVLVGTELRYEIGANLDANEQTILFMNRRGYHLFLSCRACGEVIRCPYCSVSMTLHGFSSKRLLCHYCGYSLPQPQICPSCSSQRLYHGGGGTEKLQEELEELFPNARILRMDADTTGGKNAHEKILSAFRNKKADILIGTQMVAKGHDFPLVSLVGVINTDASLYMTDYRAFENTFSLLTQVIGRAGRGDVPGRALIQTFQPLHPIINQATTQFYNDFFAGEIALRKNLAYPPFCHIAMLTIASTDESVCKLLRICCLISCGMF